MRRVKLGFIPSHREPFSERWAEQMRQRCIEAIRKIRGIDLVVPDARKTKGGLVRNNKDAQATLKLFLDKAVEGVIVGGMTFGHETSAVGALIAKLPRPTPVLHFATKGAPIAKDGFRASDSWCGQFMITSALHRRSIPFEHIPTCFPEEPIFAQWVARFARACAANSGFRNARIGQIGTRPEEFESVWWDEASLQNYFNQTVVPIDLDDLFNRVESTPHDHPSVKSTLSEMKEGVEYQRIPAAALTNLARYEVALAALAKEKELAALAVNCWPRVQERLGLAVCSALGRLTDQGILCACEVDVYGAATMLAVYHTGLAKTAPHFIDWTELHPSEPNVWLAWHCGNAPRSLCCTSCVPCYDRHSILPAERSHGTLEFRLKEGPVSCARLVEYDGFFTMFIGTGEVIDIPPYTRGSYGWVRVNDVLDWEQKMVEHGIIHHGVLIHDPAVADALESFCKFNGIEVVRGA